LYLGLSQLRLTGRLGDRCGVSRSGDLLLNKITVAELAVYLICWYWGDNVDHRFEGFVAGVAKERSLGHSV
jgi:hypothetical protein